MRITSLILCLLCTAPLLANDSPGCEDADAGTFTRGQGLYRSGQFVRALNVAEKLCACHPDNVDYQFLRALSLNALGRRDDAMQAARLAQSLAPDYREVTRFVERLQAQSAASPETAEPTAAMATSDRRWSIIAAAGAHDLTDGRDGWTEQSLAALLETASGRVAELRVDHESRGNASDASLNASLLWPLGDGRRVSAGVMLTPSATFRPEQLLTAQFEQDLPAGWVGRAGVSHRSFADDRSQGISIGIDRYYAAFRFSLGVNLATLDSAGSALSQVGSVDWYRSDRDRYRVTIGSGKELDTIADGTRVLESRVRSLTFAGQHQLNPRLAIGWWLGTLEQGNFYDRHYAGISFTRRY